MSRRTGTLTVTGFALVVVSCLVFILPVPYSTMRPGPSFDTLSTLDGQPLLTFGEGVETYETDGELAFTTVSVSRAETEIALPGALEAWWDKDVDLVPHDFLYPNNETNEDASQQGAAQLSSSQDASRAAALRALGMDVPEIVTVRSVVEESPADGVLQEGDRIVAVGGEVVDDQQQVADTIGALAPGDEVRLEIAREGATQQVTVGTVPAEDDPERARVGIVVGIGFDFPIEIENHIGDRVGGPSAGLMFALAIYDKLTPGALTGGMSVAGTGTITPDGKVGPIGGIKQKIAGAEDGGASVFLVPSANCDEAATADTSMTLVEIETMQQAVDAIELLAENPEAEVPTCSK